MFLWNCGHLWAHCLSHRWYISEYGAVVELYWQRKTKGLREKPASVPHCPPHNPTWTALCANLSLWTLSWITLIQSTSSHSIYLISILILFSHLCLGLFSSGFPTKILYVLWVSSHHGMLCPQVVDRGYNLQIRRVAAILLNKQLQTADKGWSLSNVTQGLTH
jgi:hypothetical protein